MGKLIDLTGQRFGRWVVLERASNASNGTARWVCQCDCGVKRIVIGHDLRNGSSQSCGCLQREIAAASSKKFASRDMRLYRIWCAMRKRCSNPAHPFYHIYGGRGIQVCAEWETDFGAFQSWAMDHGYSPELTIDRIDNAAGYSPQNCRWVNVAIQANNHRNNKIITYRGESRTIAQWAKITKMSYGTLLSRYNAGWSAEDILELRPSTLSRKKRKSNKPINPSV